MHSILISIRKPDAFSNALRSRRKENGPPPTRLPGLHYPMLNEKALRKKLQELGIPNLGSKPVMIKRHQEWLNLYNSNCDASDDVRKTKRELLRELDAWERTQGASVNTKESHIMRKDFDGQGYATEHKNQFDDLIANAKARAKAKMQAIDSKGDADEMRSENVDSNSTHHAQPDTNNAPTSPAPPHPYEGNEAALSTIRQKVEEANRTDSMFPALGHKTEAANMKAGRDAAYGDVPIGLAKSPKEAFESETRKVPMFRVPEEPVLDVESSTTMQ